MIKIKTEDLRNFFKKSDHIKGNNIVPMYDYIKLELINHESIELTKANGSLFIRHRLAAEVTNKAAEIGSVSPVVLIEQDMLKDAADKAQSGVIEISVKGKKISLSDGVTPSHCQLPEDNYPAIPELPEEKVQTLSFDVLEAIGIAKKHCKTKIDSNGKGVSNFVHVKKIKNKEFCVWGMNDQQVVYFKKFNKVIPEMQLDLEACGVLGTVLQAVYYRANNWMIFVIEDSVYGFLESARCTVNAEEYILGKLPEAVKHLEFDKDAAMAFCEKANSIHKGTASYPADIHLHYEPRSILLTYSNEAYAREAERNIPAVNFVGDFDGFIFSANNLLQLLRSVPFKEITLNRYKHDKTDVFFVTSTEDEDYTGLIQGLSLAPSTPKKDPVSDEYSLKN